MKNGGLFKSQYESPMDIGFFRIFTLSNFRWQGKLCRQLTTGLDARARRDVWKILDDLKQQGLSILLTSHFMDEVEALCDQILILKKGKTVFEGTTAQAKIESGKESFEEAYLWFTEKEDDYARI
jgi:ABC-type Na+ transport system ATPase subunit NatA